jgi:Fe-S-cluster-containing hydrogenase component 2
MPHRFVVCDPALCVGCQLCEFACSAAKEGVFNALYSRIRHVRIEPSTTLAVACRACEDAPCVSCCPRHALARDRESETIRVDAERCDGCAWCIEACEFGAIALDPTRGRVIVCDRCADRPEAECVAFCPKGALSISTPDVVAQRTRRSVVAKLLAELAVR